MTREAPRRLFRGQDLEGTEPSDIPIEQSTKFRSVVNLKTAEALGID
jgi:ABC-type uncharacterized transport system substrate-binding protein